MEPKDNNHDTRNRVDPVRNQNSGSVLCSLTGQRREINITRAMPERPAHPGGGTAQGRTRPIMDSGRQ